MNGKISHIIKKLQLLYTKFQLASCFGEHHLLGVVSDNISYGQIEFFIYTHTHTEESMQCI